MKKLYTFKNGLVFFGPPCIEGSQNSKSRSRDPLNPLDLIIIFSLEPLVINLRAKFEVFSFKRSLDIEGVPKL